MTINRTKKAATVTGIFSLIGFETAIKLAKNVLITYFTMIKEKSPLTRFPTPYDA
jgi:hypothetical protein